MLASVDLTAAPRPKPATGFWQTYLRTQTTAVLSGGGLTLGR